MKKTSFKDRKDLLDSPEAVKVLRKFNLKHVVAGRGHDCGGLLAVLCIGNKKLIDYKDDGWGGTPETYDLVDGSTEKVAQILKENNFAQLMYDWGWDFLDSVEDIDTETQIHCLIESLSGLQERDKIIKKTKGKFIAGDKYRYTQYGWKGVKDLSKVPVKVLQETYDEIKNGLEEGQYFYNTDEQLTQLGIKK